MATVSYNHTGMQLSLANFWLKYSIRDKMVYMFFLSLRHRSSYGKIITEKKNNYNAESINVIQGPYNQQISCKIKFINLMLELMLVICSMIVIAGILEAVSCTYFADNDHDQCLRDCNDQLLSQLKTSIR